MLSNILCQIAVAPDSIPTKSQELQMLKTLPFDEMVDRLVSMTVTFTINLMIAICVFLLGKFLINKVYQLLLRIFDRRHMDASLTTFVLSAVRIVLYFVLLIIVVGILGVETSSFIALFASAGVAIGMAFSGTLQNFAGGVLILLLKPYKVGDYIEASGYAGTVKEIQIFNTIITTPDNKSIIIPNGGLSTGSINNYSRERYRRIEWTVSISYGDDAVAARQAILGILLSDNRVVKQYTEPDDCEEFPDRPECIEERMNDGEDYDNRGLLYRLFHRRRQKLRQVIESANDVEEKRNARLEAMVDRSPQVFVGQLADSSVNLTVRAWAHNSDYWGVYYAMNERFYTELPEHGVHFPFPQLDVHLPGRTDQS